MNKSELAEALAVEAKVGSVEAEEAVNLFFDAMRNALDAGKRIEIRGFGSFSVKEYDSYWGRNPKTGERIWVGAKRLPAFKVGKELRERLNEEQGVETLASGDANDEDS